MSFQLPAGDDTLGALTGVEVTSSSASYRIGKRVGDGGMAVAFFTMRSTPEGKCPVVVKIMRPSIIRQSAPNAWLVFEKETVALGRLNERVPTTPFVVRLIDTGVIAVEQDGRRLDLPWLAVEYVHGSVEGATLTERVKYSVRATKHAFDPARAVRAIDCLAKGIDAIHEVGIIHRDIKPPNVLCCGFGDGEIFKIADFGVARPIGMAATFGGMVVGTPGYAPMELIALNQQVGPWTDVYSFAATIFYLLAGEPYFRARTVGDAIAAARDPKRRSVLEAAALCPELRQREKACREIDHVLARATAIRGADRPQSASDLAASLLGWLSMDARDAASLQKRADRLTHQNVPASSSGWSWINRQNPGHGPMIRDVSWDGDGQCLAATDRGLAFWNGTSWREAPLQGLPNPSGIRFVHRTGPGTWIVGGDGATFCTYTRDGVSAIMTGSDNSISFRHFSGALDDVAVGVGVRLGAPPMLYALVGRRWLKPLPLHQVAVVSSLARVGDARWLVTGRGTDGRGLAAIYSPLDWQIDRFDPGIVTEFSSCEGLLDRGVGLCSGTGGSVLWVGPSGGRLEQLGTKRDLSAAAIDVTGRRWAGGAGHLWSRESGDGTQDPWTCLWDDRNWTAPIASIFADIGMVVAVTADGGIVEGQSTQPVTLTT
jgi:serine/threonine protein kinase